MAELTIDDACLQFIFTIQDRLCMENGIPAANQDISLELHFSGWEDYQNGMKFGGEALGKIPITRGL